MRQRGAGGATHSHAETEKSVHSSQKDFKKGFGGQYGKAETDKVRVQAAMHMAHGVAGYLNGMGRGVYMVLSVAKAAGERGG